MVCGEGSLVLLRVASEMWEGPESSASPAGIAPREDVGKKSLALLMSMKPVLTEYEVMANGECCQRDSEGTRVNNPPFNLACHRVQSACRL